MSSSECCALITAASNCLLVGYFAPAVRSDLCIRRNRRRFSLFRTIHHLHVGHNHPFIPSFNCWVELIVMLQFACSAPADMTLQNPATRPPEYQSKINHYTKSHAAWKKEGALSESTGTFRAHRPCSSVSSLPGKFFLGVTSSSRSLGGARAHRHWGKMSLFTPPFFVLLCSSQEKQWIIWALLVTTAANVETPRFEISCGADFYTTKHLWRLMSSWIFVQMTGRFLVTPRWLKNCNAIIIRPSLLRSLLTLV